VAVFDHARNTVTIAARGRGNVKRCAWEMAHKFELPELRAPDPEALPEWVDLGLNDDVFADRARRAEQRVRAGEAAEVMLGRSFFTSLRNADPLDVYRALRVLSPSPHMFFLDFAATPFAPGVVVAGASPGSLVRAENGAAIIGGQECAAEGSPGAIFRAAFPSATVVGSPVAKAAAIVRDLEASSRGVFGGAVGYVLPDGTIDMAIADGVVMIQDGTVDVTTAAPIRAGSDAAEVVAETRRRAAPALAAVRAAQVAYEEREAAEAARKARLAAKETADREKAEKEAAEAAEKAPADPPEGPPADPQE
jgi:anthranilate synthase component I